MQTESQQHDTEGYNSKITDSWEKYTPIDTST